MGVETDCHMYYSAGNSEHILTLEVMVLWRCDFVGMPLRRDNQGAAGGTSIPWTSLTRESGATTFCFMMRPISLVRLLSGLDYLAREVRQ